ncbi:D-arabinono-1,4-lactone oxidase [Brachybacterium sp. DNPG3]
MSIGSDDAVGRRPGRSWSGTVDYGPGPLHTPGTVDELRALVGRSRSLRALGTRHSFSRVAASAADLVTLERMPADISVDTAARTVRVGAQVRYGELAIAVQRHGLALPNMGSLPHISVGGAVATGTHGSGDALRSLSNAVRTVELVTAGGDLLTLDREADADVFPGVVLSLGALGVVTHLVLDLVPDYRIRQTVHLDLPAERMTSEDLLALHAGGRSVSLFHTFDGTISQIWRKQQVDDADAADGASGSDGASAADGLAADGSWFGARRAEAGVHPLPSMPADFCTDQTGAPGPFYDRLPHFKLEFTPSNGEEIQSEFFVAREHLADAVASLTEIGERIRPLLLISELRTIAADELWLSPMHGRDSSALHFTWAREPEAVEALLPEVEERLADFAARPHWGKVFTMSPDTVRAQYPRLGDFQALRDRLDPDRVFANAYVDRLLGS